MTHIGQGGSWRLNEQGEMECIEPATREKQDNPQEGRHEPSMERATGDALASPDELKPAFESGKSKAATKTNEPDQE